MENSNINHPGYSQPIFQDEDTFDFKRYLSLFISNWYWFAIALFITITLAYGINRYSEEVYTVSSTLLIQDDQYNNNNKSGIGSIIPGGDIFRRGQNLNNEIGILKSFRLNYRVIKELPEFNIIYGTIGRRGIAETKLYKDCPFMVIADSLTVQPNMRVNVHILSKDSCRLEFDDKTEIIKDLKFGDRFNEFGFDFVVKLRDTINYYPKGNILLTRYYFNFQSRQTLTESYRNKLNISPISEGATMVTLSVSGFVAAQEADYLNKLMDLYITFGLEFKNTTANSTIMFINEQLGIISDSLSNAENDLEEFKLSNRIVDLSSEGTYIKNRIEKQENERANIELQQQYYKYLDEYVDSRNESGDIVSPSVMSITDPVLNNLVSNLAMAQKRKKSVTFNVTGKIPAVDFLDRDIELARATLKENIKNSMNSLDISLENENKLISETDSELMKLPKKERLMIGIQRKYELNNSVYTYLLEKRAEAGIAMASTVSENRIIDKASASSYILIKPKKKQNTLLAFILGFFMPGLAIFFIDYLNNKIIDRRDIERGTKTPILGFISHSDDKSEIPVISKPGSTLSESFRSIRTSLKYYIKESEPLIVSVTSTISSEGKTFSSVNLAAIISMLGKKVLLVGLDLRKPRIHKVFSIENVEGMSTFLSGNCMYSEVIKETSIENLYYASAGPVPPNPAELIETGNMKEFFVQARKQFDFIIIDTPPVAVVTDALLLADFVDLNIFIVRQRYSSKNTIGLIDELYKEKKFKNIAVIVNDISLSGYYGYGLRYGYSMGYGYTYGYNYYGKYNNRYGYSDKDQSYYTEE